MGIKLLYNPVWQEVRSVGEKKLEWEPCPSRGWAPKPPVEQPRRMGKKCCYGQKMGDQYVTVLFSLQLTSHTQPFRIKWVVYFSKELCPLVFIVPLLCFCMCMCIVGHGYTTVGLICHLETVIFHYIYECSKHVVYTDNKEVWD